MFYRYGAWLRLLLATLVTWLVPFVAALVMFDQNGKLMVSWWTFKLSMVAIFLVAAVIVLRWLYKNVPSSSRRRAPVLARSLLMVAICMVLDALFLLPMSRQPVPSYLAQVASVYLLLIPTALFISRQN
jgi:membrane-anchored protein YejM (alkaline phosphatase superfamily)